MFWENFGKDVNAKSTMMFLGDARNNYHSTNAWVLKECQKRARSVFWLNPEPRSYWDTGDSVITEYSTYTDGVFECRNLRQLEGFVDNLA
ncbi:VWA domain-containing protein [Candidatus Poriferisodalis sp.]|uniref:VWA domain-containing protein n=1 Tax=Candidatus Poriferisodalis sp. TaxID=3101277 RepID=UPI003C70382C